MTSCNIDGKQHTTPCADCPFRRTVEAGALGGSPSHVYVGQVEAGFVIPCHSSIDYDDPDWKAKASRPGGVSQCAGAAIFRANIEREKENRGLIKLPKDTDNVFASYREFVSHHEGIDYPESLFSQVALDMCAAEAMKAAGVVLTLKPRDDL